MPPASTPRHSFLPLIPASFFAMPLGLAASGNAWRLAAPQWGLTPVVGEVLEAMAILSLVGWLALYVYKWWSHGELALAEAGDPVQSSFLALLPVAVILAAVAWQPYAEGLAHDLFSIGSASNVLFGAYGLARLWTSPRQPSRGVPPVFLTFSASVLVNAMAAGLFGHVDYGWMLFGIGTVSWLVVDSVIVQQLLARPQGGPARRFPGLYLAPGFWAFVAYQVLAGEQAQPAVVQALAGYALFLAGAMVMAFRRRPSRAFAPGDWTHVFAAATLAQGLLLMAQRDAGPLLLLLAGVVFVFALLLTLAVGLASLNLMARGRYFPAADPASRAPARPR